MRQLKKFAFILSVVFISTLENLFPQNIVEFDKNKVEINKLVNGYQIFIKKENNDSYIKVKVKLNNNRYSYLYRDTTGNNNSIITITNTTIHQTLGYSFDSYIPNNLYLSSENKNTPFRVAVNSQLLLEYYDNNNNLIHIKQLTLEADKNTTNPIITLRNVEKEGDFYAFYLYYSGGNNGRYAFYVREGKESSQYKIINTSFGNFEKVDGSAIILEDTYQKGVGKKLYIKAYFKEIPEDRYLSFNVFNRRGESFTYPIDYIIENQNIIEETIETNIEENIIEENTPTPIRPNRIINEPLSPNTNIIIIGQNNKSAINDVDNKNITAKYNGEAIDIIDRASKSFQTENHLANDVNNLKDIINKIVDKYNENMDLVFVIDTTTSMAPYLKGIKEYMKTMSKKVIDNDGRVGFVLYRDVNDTYLTKKIDFNTNIKSVSRDINYLYATGGGDKPEPMYEAIQVALDDFTYINKNKVVIVITDAPAKVIGKATLETNTKSEKEKGIKIETILTKETEDKSYEDINFFKY